MEGSSTDRSTDRSMDGSRTDQAPAARGRVEGETAVASAGVAGKDQPWTVRRLLAWINGFLTEREVDSPRVVAEVLVSEVLGVERLRLYMEPERELDADELARLRALVARAGRHEPIQYLVGKWGFFGRDFLVAPCTLIPRPCTEGLVEAALEWYRSSGAGAVRALDLCTGTGCIAISLALGLRAIARPTGAGCRPLKGGTSEGVPPDVPVFKVDAPLARAGQAAPSPAGSAAGSGFTPSDLRGAASRVVATDVVPAAIELARANAARLGADVELHVGDMWSAVPEGESFDLVVSNPPYVTDAEYAALDRNVREYEPASALRGGPDGLDFVRRVVDGASTRLRRGGLLLIEIGWRQGEGARRLVSGAEWTSAGVLKDAEGHDRILRAVRA